MIWRWIAGALVLAAGIAAGAAFFWMKQLEPVYPDSSPAPQIFEVERGRGLGQVARALERANLIRDARAMILLARWRGDEGRLMIGEYELSAGWSTRTILDRIISGRVMTYEVVLPEGIRADEIALRLEAAGLADAEEFLAETRNAEFALSLGIEADGLEGFLYPETYRLPRGLTAREIAKIFVAQFEQVWNEIDPEIRDQPMSRSEVVTLASIVEKETAAPEERPVIAAVFHNRMRLGMRLETDPTVIYGIPDFDGNITRAHLRDRSNAYNTYRIPGLPPGPIANPGVDALLAVLQPAESDFLYFVSRGDGTHHFSETYREHTNAVRKYQLRRRKR